MHHLEDGRSSVRALQALLERFPGEAADARWQPLERFLAVNPDVRRLNRAMGGRMLDFDPAAAITPRRVRLSDVARSY